MLEFYLLLAQYSQLRFALSAIYLDMHQPRYILDGCNSLSALEQNEWMECKFPVTSQLGCSSYNSEKTMVQLACLLEQFRISCSRDATHVTESRCRQTRVPSEDFDSRSQALQAPNFR